MLIGGIFLALLSFITSFFFQEKLNITHSIPSAFADVSSGSGGSCSGGCGGGGCGCGSGGGGCCSGTPVTDPKGHSGGDGGDTGGGDTGGDPGGSCCCFVEETPVLMADGSQKQISEVEVGDMVLGFDELGNLKPQHVSRLFKFEDKEILDLNGIRVTPGHRFLTVSGEYKSAKDLIIDDILVSRDGLPITGWSIKPILGQHTVYNFTVEELHTYVAGGFRVHNAK